MLAPRIHLALGLHGLLLATLTLPGADAGPPAPAQQGRGARFFSWLGREMPELALRVMNCVKRNDKETRDVVLAVFGDLGKCFDEAKGSVLYTVECMLKNGVSRLLNVVAVAHKVAGCVTKNKRDARLCLSVSHEKDDTCPFAIGL